MVVPRCASTVVLVRPDENGGFDVLLTRRPDGMRFLGGFYVFPGGTVHESDYAPAVLRRCRGISGEAARRILDNRHEPEEALGHWVAVLRELFEEVGVLLCVDENGQEAEVNNPAVKQRIERARQAIVREDLDFAVFLESESLFCDLARAVYFDHWVTPAIYSMRFDTRFFIAVAPPKQKPLIRSEEVTHSLWIRAEDALARIDRHDFPILPPTTTVLQRLAHLATWERLCAEFNLP
jgi:8-oxo-dGTP pyrophosphatase MutT (NUDIX family)